MNSEESPSPIMIGLYWAILAACVICLLGGVVELVTQRYLTGIATMAAAGLVFAATFRSRESFFRRSLTLDASKAVTRSIPTNMRVQLTLFCAALVIGGLLGVLLAVAEFERGAVGLGLLIGLPCAFFAVAGASGAVAFWLPKNRGPA